MSLTITVEGDGVAACCCLQLLGRSELRFKVERTERASPLTVLVSPGTQRLLSDVFADPNLFEGMPSISKRIVLWGQQREPLILPHSGIAVTEGCLLQRLWDRTKTTEQHATNAPDWRVISRRQQVPFEEHKFGSRVATAVEVELKEGADAEACWIESMAAGWVFLLPSGSGKASLLCVGDSAEKLLGQSRLIVQQIESLSEAIHQFPAYPRIAHRLCTPGLLLCGTAAMGFDPVCGEGAGNAVREAILASAAIQAIKDGADKQLVLQHYSSRLLAGFLRHLQSCREFYSAARSGPWWDAELAQLERGIEWTGDQLSQLPPASYRLVNFELRPLMHADQRR